MIINQIIYSTIYFKEMNILLSKFYKEIWRICFYIAEWIIINRFVLNYKLNAIWCLEGYEINIK